MRRGQEHFRGCVTVPIFDARGQRQRHLRPAHHATTNRTHLYLPGPHRGVWNGAAAKTNQTLFIAEAILDGMSLWQAGFKNVIALYGTNGWTADHEQLLQRKRHDRSFSLPGQRRRRQDSDRTAKRKIAAAVWSRAVHVMQWPEGVKDAADFFLSRSAADFEALLPKAMPPRPPRPKANRRPGRPGANRNDAGRLYRQLRRRAVTSFAPSRSPSAARLKATSQAPSGEPGPVSSLTRWIFT